MRQQRPFYNRSFRESGPEQVGLDIWGAGWSASAPGSTPPTLAFLRFCLISRCTQRAKSPRRRTRAGPGRRGGCCTSPPPAAIIEQRLSMFAIYPWATISGMLDSLPPSIDALVTGPFDINAKTDTRASRKRQPGATSDYGQGTRAFCRLRAPRHRTRPSRRRHVRRKWRRVVRRHTCARRFSPVAGIA